MHALLFTKRLARKRASERLKDRHKKAAGRAAAVRD